MDGRAAFVQRAEAYSNFTSGQIAPWKVAEFLILHDCFPRALRHCVHQVDFALHRISGVPEDRFSNEAERLSGKMRGDLDYTRIGGNLPDGPARILAPFTDTSGRDQSGDGGDLL